MSIRLKYHSPNGETRPWTIGEIIQGKPIDRPTHPMFVHFPIAFYIAALGLDVLSRAGGFPAAPLAATWLILGALAGFAAAAITGLVERSTMRRGSKIRELATRHMMLQYIAVAVFAASTAIRWPHRHDADSAILWVILDVVGVLIMMVGADIGGRMVYKTGYRGLG